MENGYLAIQLHLIKKEVKLCYDHWQEELREDEWKRKEFQNLAKRIKEENRRVTFRTIGESMYKGGRLL